MSDSDEESTTVPVTKATRRRLKVWKTEGGLTYDEAVNHPLDRYKGQECVKTRTEIQMQTKRPNGGNHE